MDWLTLALAAVYAGYSIWSNNRSYGQAERVNSLAQSNFENQYQITSQDMQKAGFNPMSLFSGGQLNQYSTGQTSEPGQNPFEGLLSSMANMSKNSLFKSQLAQQKEMQDANIDLIKAQTVAQLLDNDKIASLLNGENGNLFLKSMLEELGLKQSASMLNNSQSNYYSDYWSETGNIERLRSDTQRYIAKLDSDTQKDIQKSAQTFESLMTKNKAVVKYLDNVQQNYLAQELAILQHRHNVSETVISSLFSNWQNLYSAYFNPDWNKALNRVFSQAFNDSKTSIDSNKRDAFVKDFKKILDNIFK